MQKQDMTVLIVDDDATMGKAMAEALTRTGYKAIHVTKPDDALGSVKLQAIHAAVIDCMLPKMNGRELAKRLRAEVSPTLPVILVSGIYKDKSFMRDAIQETGAKAFLTKPFELPDFVDVLNKALKADVDEPLAMLQQFLAKNDLTPKERMAAVDEADMVHGFDLPWIYSLLMHQKVSGHLNIITADGDVCGVGFSNGNIVQVYQEDLKSYFGVLMVEYGFITQNDLDEAMKGAPKSKRLGDVLVQANLLSPHAIQIVMADQQGIRLSKTVSNTSVKVNFIEADDMRVNANTDRGAYTDLLNEWLVSKISLDWLKSTYVPWLRYNLKKGPEWSATHRAMQIPVVARVQHVAQKLLDSETLEAAQALVTEPEDHFYRAVHALIVSRVLRFDQPASRADYDAQRARLTKLLKTLDGQNYFERLGASDKAKESELKRAYHDLAKVLHPDKLSPDAPTDVRELAKKTFERIATAYATLTDAKAKEKYLLELEKGKAEAVMQAEQMMEEARPLLTKGDIRKAREILEAAVKLAPPTADLKLMMCWAKLKGPEASKDKQMQNAVKDELAQVPPEDRHNVLYYFVRGMWMRVTGDADGARRHLEHVLAQMPDHVEARRELNLVNEKREKTSMNILSGDLKDVVGMLFRKKK